MFSSYWEKASQISEAVKELGTKSVRKIAQATGVGKTCCASPYEGKSGQKSAPRIGSMGIFMRPILR